MLPVRTALCPLLLVRYAVSLHVAYIMCLCPSSLAYDLPPLPMYPPFLSRIPNYKPEYYRTRVPCLQLAAHVVVAELPDLVLTGNGSRFINRINLRIS